MRILVRLAAALAVIVAAGGASGATTPDGDWLAFGRTTDNMRHSPLTQITPANDSQLGRVYNLDLKTLDADTRRGEQSFPLALNGTLYVTTNDAQVFALNGVTIMLSEALKEYGIAVNSMCPGWVRTDMGGSAAPRSVEEGADTAVWLAAEADQNLTGKLFRDRKEIAW